MGGPKGGGDPTLVPSLWHVQLIHCRSALLGSLNASAYDAGIEARAGPAWESDDGARRSHAPKAVFESVEVGACMG